MYIYLQDNLEEVEKNIQESLHKVDRKDDKINLIAVSKNVDVDSIEKSIELGVDSIGENRVQELQGKIAEIGNNVNYHMIGHLQTNKVKYIIDKVSLIHSLDRISLAKELNKRAKMNDLNIDALIQVNVSEEKTKHGLKVEEVIPFIEKILKFGNINIKGLMTIAPHTDDEKLLRSVFSGLYDLKEEIKEKNYKNIKMDYLSMGMTNDYQIAIEEGSNMIRVGTGIYGKRKY